MSPEPPGAYDVLIVGGGSAGCVLAARLAEDPSRRVLLLEAGRNYGTLDSYPQCLQRGYSAAASLPGNPNAWSYMGQLTPTRSYPVTRGKLLGGSSAVNGGQFTRGTPADFDQWAAAGNDEWSFEKVLPFFVKLEHDLDFSGGGVHGDKGPVPVIRARYDELTTVAKAFVDTCLEQGHGYDTDMNAPQSEGIGLTPHNVLDGLRQNTAIRYLVDVGIPGNLTVLDRTLVYRVLFNGRRACGVEALVDGRRTVFQADEVILSAGGINSPHLLNLSGIGPADTLRSLGIRVVHDSPGVGRGFMDHPSVHVTYRADGYTPRAGNLTASQVCLNYSASGSRHVDDMRIFPSTYPKGAMLFGMRGESLTGRAGGLAFLTRPLRTWRGIRGMTPQALSHDVRHRADLSLYCGLDFEESRGNLTLQSADPSKPLRIDYNYMSEPEDLRRLRECVRVGVDMLHAPAFAQLGAHVTGATTADLATNGSLDRWLLSNIATAYHTARSCRMGPDQDPHAVVDQYCRVRGVDGLRVVDISIMPTLVRRGPNATAIMIGERAAALFDNRPYSALPPETLLPNPHARGADT